MKCVSFIVFFLALVGTTFAQHPKKAVKAYEAAEEAFLKRDYKKAQQQVLKAVTEDPNYAEAWPPYKTAASSAQPRGSPGCPDFAF